MTTLNDLVEVVLEFIEGKTTVEELVQVLHFFKSNSLDDELRSPLGRAAEQGNIELVKILIENGAKIDVYDDNNQNPLHLAQNEDVMEVLLEDATLDEINALDDNWETPLHYASRSGNTAIMTQLIDKGADVDTVMEGSIMGGETALQVATRAGKIDAMELLLKSGASKKYRNDWGELAWHLAFQFITTNRERYIPGGKEYWREEVMPKLI
jgi:ankyrin repeat protein